jgi:hypothetical protein
VARSRPARATQSSMCEDHAPAVATEVKGIAAESQEQQRGRGGAATCGKSGHALRRVVHTLASDGKMMPWLVVAKSGGSPRARWSGTCMIE